MYVSIYPLAKSMSMAVAARAPKPKFARKGANPSLELLEYVRAILVQAGEPVSRNQIMAHLAQWGHSTNRPTLNAALDFLGQDGSVIDGSKGLQWIPEAKGKLLATLRASRVAAIR